MKVIHIEDKKVDEKRKGKKITVFRISSVM